MSNRSEIFISVFASAISVILIVLIANYYDPMVNERTKNIQPGLSTITVKVLTTPMVSVGKYHSDNHLTFMAEEVRKNDDEANASVEPLLCFSHEIKEEYIGAATWLEYARTKGEIVELIGRKSQENNSIRFEIYSVSVSGNTIIIKK